MTAVVVGSGCIGPYGYGPEALVRARRDGRADDRRTIDDFDASAYLQRRGLRPLSRASLLAAVAAAAALGQPAEPAGARERRGVVLGTRWASLEPLFDFERTAARDGPALVSPAQFPNVVVNVHAGYLGILFQRGGPNVTVCGPAAGLEAIGQALDLLLLDRASNVLAGGADALGEPVLRGLERAGYEPAEEAAAFLLLAPEGEHPSPTARIAAYATGPPTADGVVEAALNQAGVAADDVAAYWLAGAAPWRLVRAVGRARIVEGVSGAAGALAAVAAAETVAGTAAPAVAASFPADAKHIAVVLAPADGRDDRRH